VDQNVTSLTNDIDAGLSENLRILIANPFLYELGRLETGWHHFGNRLSFWDRLLTLQATELASVVTRLDQLGKTWDRRSNWRTVLERRQRFFSVPRM
jgi:hypothetical protein